MSNHRILPTQIKALVDTGAMMNIIKMGIFPGHVFSPTQNPVTLVGANGCIIAGGQLEITLDLTFIKEGGEHKEPLEWHTTATFIDADVHMEAILGCEWLDDKELGVFLHLRALAFSHSKMAFLRE